MIKLYLKVATQFNHQQLFVVEMMKESEYAKYVDLLANMTSKKFTSYPHFRAKSDRYEINPFRNEKQLSLTKKQSINNNTDHQFSPRNFPHTSFSEGDLCKNNKKSTDRNNLYQLYCQQILKKKSDDNMQYPQHYRKKQKNDSISYIFDKVKLEQKQACIHLPSYKSKILRNQSQNNKTVLKRSYRRESTKAQPTQLNIGAINSHKMPKIRKTGNILDYKNSLKLEENLKKIRQNSKQISYKINRLSGWQADQQEQSMFRLL